MNKALSVVKFDLITVKPYLKSMLFLIPLGLLFGISNNNVLMIPPMFMVWSSLLTAYPFSIGEKSSLDKFLGTTSLRRKSVVTGRYMFSCLSSFLILLLALAIVFISYAFSKEAIEMEAVIFDSCISFVLYSFIVSFQIPLYFKLGYLKAKTVTILPLFLIGFIIPAISFIPSDNGIAVFLKKLSKIIEDLPYFSSLMLIFISFAILLLSHTVSCKIYINKEL